MLDTRTAGAVKRANPAAALANSDLSSGLAVMTTADMRLARHQRPVVTCRGISQYCHANSEALTSSVTRANQAATSHLRRKGVARREVLAIRGFPGSACAIQGSAVTSSAETGFRPASSLSASRRAM